MSKYNQKAWLMIGGLLITALIAGCGGSKSNGGGYNDSSTSVSLTLANGSLLTDNLQNTDNWEFLNGATGKVSNGVLTVTAPTAEGIAMKLKDSVWAKIGSPTSYYVEMLFKPTSLPTTNKNIGIASNISSNNSQWYYAGFNANGRMQAGSSAVLKGYENTGDGTSLASSSDFIYYKWRYENENGTIRFYSNDLFMGKNDTIFNYTPGLNYTGSVGVYSCGASFEIAAVRIGALGENKTKLILTTSESSLPQLNKKYVRLINNTSSTGIRVDDEVNFTVTALNSGGTAEGWTATSTNSGVLAVTASGTSGGTLKVKGMGIGTATVIVSNVSDPGSKRALTFAVYESFKYGTDAYTGIDNKVYPNIGASAAYTDGELAITFDSNPTITDKTGEIYIYQSDNMSKVDTIKFSNATEAAFSSERGNTLNIGTQMARIEGNTLYFTPHFEKLTYGAKYCIVIPNGIISGTLNGKTFTGFSPTQKTWTFTTQAAPSISGKVITVDGSQSSTANFRTVQKALKYVADNAATMDGAIIQIARGTYRELLTVGKNISFTLKGMGSEAYGSDVIIQYINGNNMNGNTLTRPVVLFNTTGTVNLVNLTLKNPESKSVVAQAETIYFSNVVGKLIAKNCTFKSEQDTLQVNGYNWFKNCYIEGSTDYIWGAPVVSLFENCSLKCISEGSIICHARCTQTSKGFVFFDCNIEVVKGTNYLARDMSGTEKYYDNIAFVNCTITGSGTLNWYNDFAPTPVGTGASMLVGWKYYGLTSSNQAYAVTSNYDYELSASEYTADYSSKATILGRPTSSDGAWVATNAWSPMEP